MPVAFVPPENSKPFESQYIERSTMIGTPFVTWITAPKYSSCSSLNSLVSMLKRLVAFTVYVLMIGAPASRRARLAAYSPPSSS